MAHPDLRASLAQGYQSGRQRAGRETFGAPRSDLAMDYLSYSLRVGELLKAVDLLAGYPGDELEVLIEVEDGEPCGFSRRGGQQVGD